MRDSAKAAQIDNKNRWAVEDLTALDVVLDFFDGVVNTLDRASIFDMSRDFVRLAEMDAGLPCAFVEIGGDFKRLVSDLLVTAQRICDLKLLLPRNRCCPRHANAGNQAASRRVSLCLAFAPR